MTRGRVVVVEGGEGGRNGNEGGKGSRAPGGPGEVPRHGCHGEVQGSVGAHQVKDENAHDPSSQWVGELG